VADALANAVARYGAPLSSVLPTCALWVNGEPARPEQPLGPDDELAVLPPVSGG